MLFIVIHGLYERRLHAELLHKSKGSIWPSTLIHTYRVLSRYGRSTFRQCRGSTCLPYKDRQVDLRLCCGKSLQKLHCLDTTNSCTVSKHADIYPLQMYIISYNLIIKENYIAPL